MLRFIIKREIKDGYNGLTDSGFETVDIDVPELESILLGGGSSENSYDHRALAGVEILAAAPQPPAALVPLTGKAVAAIADAVGFFSPIEERAAFISGLRHGEAAHGITGAPDGS